MGINKLNIQTVCSYFHIASTLLLFCSIPFFYSRFTQYGLIFFFSSFVIDYIASERWKKGFNINYSRIISFLLILQVVLLYIFSFFEQDPSFLSTFYEYRLAYLGFGFVGLLGLSDKFRVRHFAYSSLISVVALFVSVYSFIPDWFSNLGTLSEKLQVLVNIRGENLCSHMTINLFLCAGMALFCKVFTLSNSKWEKIFSIFVIFLYFILIIMADGRIGMFNACLLLGCILLRLTIKKLKFLISILSSLVVIGILGLCVIFTDNPIKSRIPALNKVNAREYIWEEGINKIKQSPILGVGASTNAVQFKEMLVKNEELNNSDKFLLNLIQENKLYSIHPHNQIMQSWQEYGLIGLLAILGLFITIILSIRSTLTLCMIFTPILIQLQTDIIDGGITVIGFCTYIYLMLVLLESKQVGKEKIGSFIWTSRTPSNA